MDTPIPMILLLTVVYVLQRSLAVPIQGVILEDRAASTCTADHCRSLWNIVWSCIVTIFACTWVAVHPNVPTPAQSAHRRWYSHPLRRARIMLYALIVPELVVIWASRQRTAARRTSEILKDWSRVHGFFAVMGGFVDGEEVLSLGRIEELVRNEEIEYPIASREEIQDRSKGDAVSKALVMSQTTWFLLQCIARASQHLAVTKLELATVAFAMLNVIMYVLWRDKPLDVQCPIRVRRRRSGNHQASEERDQVQEGSNSKADQEDQVTWLDPFFAMLGMANEGEDEDFMVVGEQQSDGMVVMLLLGGILVTFGFGGIHCIGWSFNFPSHAEQVLWRMSAISITTIPLGFLAIAFITLLPGTALLGILIFVLSFLYILSRMLLLVLSLTTLRSLPSSAFQAVKWTTFLPHV